MHSCALVSTVAHCLGHWDTWVALGPTDLRGLSVVLDDRADVVLDDRADVVLDDRADVVLDDRADVVLDDPTVPSVRSSTKPRRADVVLDDPTVPTSSSTTRPCRRHPRRPCRCRPWPGDSASAIQPRPGQGDVRFALIRGDRRTRSRNRFQIVTRQVVGDPPPLLVAGAGR